MPARRVTWTRPSASRQCAFVGREGERPFPLAPTPTLEVPDLLALAEKLGA